MFRSWSDLEEVPGQITGGTPNPLFTGLTQRQVASTTMGAVPRHQQGERLTPRNSVGGVPAVALGALVPDPKITWL